MLCASKHQNKNMIELTLADIALAIDGELYLGDSGATENTVISGVADTDSRLITPGDIFIAKPGEEGEIK